MQDFTGVPAVVDLAAMRDAMADLGGDAAEDQPARARRARHRPLGAGRRLRHPRRVPHQRRARVRAQPGALRLPALGPGRLRQLRGRPARHRDRPPGQPRVPRARGLRRRRDGTSAGLPRHAGRDGLAHDDDQRPRRARLGRRRHRGRGRDARPADVDADPAGARLQALRRAARGRDRHRPRADRDPDAARARRGGHVRRVLRPRRRRAAAGRPRDDRQHVARSSARPARSSRSTPRRCATSSSPAARRSASRWSRPTPRSRACGTTSDSEEPTYSDTLELDLGDVVPSLAGPEAPAGPRLADGVQGRLPARARGPAARRRRGPAVGRAGPRRGERRLLPGLGPAGLRRPNGHGRARAAAAAADGGTGGLQVAERVEPPRRSRSRTAPRPSSTTATS